MSEGDKKKRSVIGPQPHAGAHASARAGSGSARARRVVGGGAPGALAGTPFGIAPVGTLGEVVLHRAEGTLGADVRFLFVDDDDADPRLPPEGDDRSVVMSYRDVLDTARRAANALAGRGVVTGDKVLLVLRTGPSFLAAFLGCQLLGAIPVPAVPPYSLARIEEYCDRIARLAINADAVAVVTFPRMLPVFKVARGRSREGASRFASRRSALANVILGSDLLCEEEAIDEVAVVSPDDPAMIQYTSGSTGAQKGVLLSHRNLLANVRSIGEAAKFREGDVALAWLPLYHDMGLIGHFIAAQAWGIPLVLMPPEMFVKRPKEWLLAIDRYRGSCSAAPNFAYNLCVKKVRPSEAEQIDLSSWRVAFCGAEPIHPETVRNFITHFAPSGFRPETFFPVYGMAELSLAATFPPAGRVPVYDRIDRRAFERDGVAAKAAADAPEDSCMTWVSVGHALPRHEVQIVDKEMKRLPDRRQGEILVRGPSLMIGYYKNDVATAEAIRDGWLRTGDLGYSAEGELYVTGRRKEIIIKGGKNLYPQDVEAAACRVDGVRAGCCAAFGLRNDARGTEDLIVICETRATDPEARRKISTEVKRSILEATGASPDEVVLAPPGTVPKTSSGKIQRDLARQRWQKNELGPGRPSTRTLVKLKLAQAVQDLRDRAGKIGSKLAAFGPRKRAKRGS